jgi:LmbE family N-acetylglucosaminyl deacetylase
MIQLQLNISKNKPLNVLCLGSHSDDIEIGCGGTILHLVKNYPEIQIYWVVFSAIGKRKEEAQQSVQLFVSSKCLKNLKLLQYRDGFFPYEGEKVKEQFEDIKRSFSPDLIFTHQSADAHQDHRLISELTWNTFRNHLILEYEIPKYDGDLGRPSVFMSLEPDEYDTKVCNLMNAFQSQVGKNWFQESTFKALMRLRGMECNAPSGYAEAFYARKLLL